MLWKCDPGTYCVPDQHWETRAFSSAPFLGLALFHFFPLKYSYFVGPDPWIFLRKSYVFLSLLCWPFDSEPPELCKENYTAVTLVPVWVSAVPPLKHELWGGRCSLLGAVVLLHFVCVIWCQLPLDNSEKLRGNVLCIACVSNRSCQEELCKANLLQVKTTMGS